MTIPDLIAAFDDIGDNYEVAAVPLGDGDPVVSMLCRRCTHVMVIVRPDGEQTRLTLAELVEQAADHEAERHLGGES